MKKPYCFQKYPLSRPNGDAGKVGFSQLSAEKGEQGKFLPVAVFSVILTLFRMASSFLVTKVIAVNLGPSGVAMLGQLQSFASAANGIVSAPVGNGVVKFTAAHYEIGVESCAPWWRAALFIFLAMVIPIVLGLVSTASLFSVWLFGHEDFAWKVSILAVGLPLAGINTFISSVINGQQNFRRYISLNIYSVAFGLAVTMCLIWAEHLDFALLAAASSSALGGLVMLLSNLRSSWVTPKVLIGKVEKEKLKQVSGFVAMALTSAIFAPVTVIIIRKMLAARLGWDAAGTWQATTRVSEAYLAIVMLILNIYYLPRLSKLNCHKAMLNVVISTAKILMPMVGIGAVLIYVFRDIAISLLFTEDFRGARELFSAQLIGDFLKILSWLFAYTMLARGAYRWYMASEVIFSASFVGLSYALLHWFSLKGVVAAYGLNYAIYLSVLVFKLRRLASESPNK